MKIPLEILDNIIKNIKREFEDISYSLDEPRKRLWCAVRAKAYNPMYGRGGVMIVHKATNISRPTIYAGLSELDQEEKLPKQRIRKKGGGREKITQKYPQILTDLENLIEPLTWGDPESTLRWSCKSTYNLCQQLILQGYEISQRTVCDLLSQLGYSLQSHRKTEEGGNHPDRNAQFEHINQKEVFL